jgi:protein translocase SecG subunit
MGTLAMAHIAVSVALIALIALQEQSSDTPGVFGGGAGGGGFYQTRRGLEKFLFGATVCLTAAFIILAALNLALPSL